MITREDELFALLGKYATAAPRYTSYPTTLDWDPDFDPSAQPRYLERAAASSEPLPVYVHLPFCRERCLFCGCNVTITRSESRVDQYLNALEREVEALADHGLGRRPVTEMHWGGGTPTHLDTDRLARLFRLLETELALSDDTELAIEVDPRVTSPEQIRLLAQLGFRRLSLGIQDLDEDVQNAIKRVQPEDATRRLVELAREVGFRSINVDLMYGLPRQTRAGFARTIERVLELQPERLAIFHYAHVPWFKPHQKALDREAMPTARERLGIFLEALSQLEAQGYAHLGLDHFARPGDQLAAAHREGRLHRDFMGYTARPGGDLLALGASAIGELGGAFLQNVPDERHYRERVTRTDGLACVRGHALSPDDRLRRDVILGILCNDGVEKSTVEHTHGIDFDEHFASELSALVPLAADGLVTLDTERVAVTPAGRLFLRNVASVFDRHLQERLSDAASSYSQTH